MMGTIIAHGGHNSRLLPYHTVPIYKSTIMSDIYQYI